jgi:2-polyprenyl-3-methyl-5-hydroxy-6-metoxy-1,4-benzoquinol methylase
MDPAYARRYRDLATRHWWWRARNACVRREVTRLLGTRRDARMLDVGCGDGVLFPFLSGFGEVEGVEPDPDVITPGGPWRDSIQVRPFDESFGTGRRYTLILMLDVLEHLEDAAGALRHAAALLDDGGHLLVTVPAFRTLWTHHDTLNHHVTRFTKRRLAAAVHAAGMDVQMNRYLFQWLFFAKLAERLREAVAGPPPPEEVPPRYLNDALYYACRMEQSTASRVLPFGSSLIAVIGRRHAVRR